MRKRDRKKYIEKYTWFFRRQLKLIKDSVSFRNSPITSLFYDKVTEVHRGEYFTYTSNGIPGNKIKLDGKYLEIFMEILIVNIGVYLIVSSRLFNLKFENMLDNISLAIVNEYLSDDIKIIEDILSKDLKYLKLNFSGIYVPYKDEDSDNNSDEKLFLLNFLPNMSVVDSVLVKEDARKDLYSESTTKYMIKNDFTPKDITNFLFDDIVNIFAEMVKYINSNLINDYMPVYKYTETLIYRSNTARFMQSFLNDIFY